VPGKTYNQAYRIAQRLAHGESVSVLTRTPAQAAQLREWVQKLLTKAGLEKFMSSLTLRSVEDK
jgi:hypothetical protein